MLTERRLPRAGVVGRTRLHAHEDLVTVLAGAWLIVGLFLDGWAHNNSKPESFFTPWHGVFYSGFLVTAAWIGWQVRRRYAAGARGALAVPVGYGLGVAGLLVFAAGGIFDMVWHELFGVEVDIEALLSPSHLVLLAGALLVLTSPLRSAWSDPSSRAPTFTAFAPVVLATTLVTALVAFFFMYLSPFTDAPATTGDVEYGVASILLTTLILMGPPLLLLLRWRVPGGTFTVLFTVVAVCLNALESFFLGWTILAAVVAGVAADVLVRWWRPSPDRPWAYRGFAAAVPAVLWLAYFAVIDAEFGVAWSLELWGGVTTMAALAGCGLALLMTPPRMPADV